MSLRHIHHGTSQPLQFFGREAELRLLDDALSSSTTSVIAFIGPGGQGKTAIVQHWLEQHSFGRPRVDGVFLWSFYRGKDAELCLRQLLADVAGAAALPEVSATYCVDKLVALLRERRWVVVLDGLEVVQYESGPWFGRMIHPELGRLLEEMSSAPAASVVVVTTRFPLPEQAKRRHARLVSLASLDPASARELLRTLGVRGEDGVLDDTANSCTRHAKAVELLGTYLVHYHGGEATGLPKLELGESGDEERQVAGILAAHQAFLAMEVRDILALATAFREPATRERLLEYLPSAPARTLLHETWGRTYAPFVERPAGWLSETLDRLIALRLLEEVEAGAQGRVLDAHPLVRRGFENALGGEGRRQSATARAGFLHGRPDRRKPASLEEAREEIELFHAYCDARLWDEADRVYRALDRPRYRFVAPALERDLLSRFFPDGDWRRPPLWPGFRHWRALAVCLEMLGAFADAIEVYRSEDAPLRGDALIALARLEPLLGQAEAPHPWQVLWRAYRAHALCLAGRATEGVALAASLVPVDIYEWTHVFECLLRAGRLDLLDMGSFLFRPASAAGHRWADLARARMRLDFLRVTAPDERVLDSEYPRLIEEYDRAGLPYERCLARLSYARWLLCRKRSRQADEVNQVTAGLSDRHQLRLVAADAADVSAAIAAQQGDPTRQRPQAERASQLRASCDSHATPRP